MMKIFGAENGELTESVINYYRARARGGAALISTGLLEVLGRNIERYPRIDDDRYVPGLRTLAEAIHGEGVPVVASCIMAGPLRAILFSVRRPLPDGRSRDSSIKGDDPGRD